MKYVTYVNPSHGCLWWLIIGWWWMPVKWALGLVKWLVLIILLLFVD